MSDGTRKVTSISEITGMEGDVITMQEIFLFEKLGVTQDGKVIGRFRATGVRPKVLRAAEGVGHPPAAGHVRRRDGGAVMAALVVCSAFVVGAGARRRRATSRVTQLPGDAGRSGKLEPRLRRAVGADRRGAGRGRPNARQARSDDGPLPALDRLVGRHARAASALGALDRAVGRADQRRAPSC